MIALHEILQITAKTTSTLKIAKNMAQVKSSQKLCRIKIHQVF